MATLAVDLPDGLTLEQCMSLLRSEGRPALLQQLALAGVDQIAQRQAIAKRSIEPSALFCRGSKEKMESDYKILMSVFF